MSGHEDLIEFGKLTVTVMVKGPCNDCVVPGGCVLAKYIEDTGQRCERKEKYLSEKRGK